MEFVPGSSNQIGIIEMQTGTNNWDAEYGSTGCRVFKQGVQNLNKNKSDLRCSKLYLRKNVASKPRFSLPTLISIL